MAHRREPAPRVASNMRNAQPTETLPLFVLKYNKQQVLVALPEDYEQLQSSIRDHFPNIPADHRISYFTKNLPICKGVLTKISREIWASTIPKLDNLIVQSEARASSSVQSGKRPIKKEEDRDCQSGSESDDKPLVKKPRRDSLPKSALSIPPQENVKKKFTLHIVAIKDGVEERRSVDCSPSTTFRKLSSWITSKLGFFSSSDFRMIWAGRQMDEGRNDTLASLGVQDGDIVHVIERLKGGKPVIYLFAPTDSQINASVKLSLVPEWHFSGIYPVVPVKFLSSGEQTLTWDVNAAYDGTLLELKTGLEVAYLFWEAEALNMSPSGVSNSASGRTTAEETFIPTHPQLDPTNSVVLEVAKLTPYLDSVLKVLGLHVEARTSFITYWLPSFLKHKHIALRFLPQSAYERAAPLVISPPPDVVVRVFMLFKGFREDDISRGGWKNATEGGITQWKTVVGIDESRKLDDGSLFRVVEWGGMEVL